MKFKELTEDKISDFIINDPKLVYLGFSDQDLVQMHQEGKYECSPGSYYIGIEDENEELICILKWELFERQVVSVHTYVKSSLHGKGAINKIYHFLYNHFVENTDIRKVIIFAPEPCIHVIKAAKKLGFKKEGYISNACTWRKEVQGIFIYGLDIIRQKNET